MRTPSPPGKCSAEIVPGDGSDLLTELGEHEDLALSLNYWFNSNLVFKLSYHLVDGNIFAVPDDLEGIEADVVDKLHRRLEIGIGLAGKADNKIRGHADVRSDLA